MEWLDYREKLNLGFNDEKKGAMCISVIQNKLDDLISKQKKENALAQNAGFLEPIFDTQLVSQAEYRQFCNDTKTRWETSHTFYISYMNDILDVLEKQKDTFKGFLSYYIAFINCLADREGGLQKQELLTLLYDSFEECRLKYAVLNDDGKYFVFPKGAKELDDKLVSEPIEWLSDYPTAKKIFVMALKQYQEGIYIRDTADNLRKALEAFLQEFLHNEKNLETNKNEICRYLGGQGVDAGVSGLFQPLINAYKNLNDRIAKHNDRVDEKMLEFLLYQTGILIRMVLVVKQSEMEATTNAD